jgi:hypothetical protein
MTLATWLQTLVLGYVIATALCAICELLDPYEAEKED